MTNDLNIIPGLSGEEVVQDICAALAEKLRGDCNLRPIDQYVGGYEAEISIKIKCFGLDQAAAEYSLEIKNTTSGADLSLPDTVIDTELKIPVETDLSEVRDRSNQPVPDFEMKPAIEITADGPVPAQPQPRRYSRRLKALGVAQGGATVALEE